MDDLVQWLRAQLDEDERIARKAPPGPWIGTDAEDIGAWSVYDPEWLIASATVYTHDKPMGGKRGPGYIDASATTAHIARHDPARVLREIAAKRRIIEVMQAQAKATLSLDESERVRAEAFGHATLRLLALPYADRPGYRKEWRP